MKHILEPLARIAGVRTAALITNDGVPITVQGRAAPRGGGEVGELDALAALAAGWVGEVNRATAPLAWDAPRHLVLRAARGTLVAMQAPGALLVVVLESGSSAEELRLPMEATVGRMMRHLRPAAGSKPSTAAPASAEQSSAMEPRAPLPVAHSSQPTSRESSQVPAREAGQGFANTGNTNPMKSGD
ncbi:MAG: roadblock/LC7 domain-containing protein [Planctomycetota bacterium]|nr:roadblock/LC7 domain-containing protein [Planctomycetota bacterium]